MQYAEPISRLIKVFSRLPGIGEKTATRLALYILNSDEGYVREFAESLVNVKTGVRLCRECMSFAEDEVCGICSDGTRDGSMICVVGDYRDMMAIEGSGGYRGRYHVLHGNLAPLKGIGPDDIRIKELLRRVETNSIKEIILATGFDSEGEATAIYLLKLLKPYNLRLTRIASGVPVGSYIEYMDTATLQRAMAGRKEI